MSKSVTVRSHNRLSHNRSRLLLCAFANKNNIRLHMMYKTDSTAHRRTFAGMRMRTLSGSGSGSSGERATVDARVLRWCRILPLNESHGQHSSCRSCSSSTIAMIYAHARVRGIAPLLCLLVVVGFFFCTAAQLLLEIFLYSASIKKIKLRQLPHHWQLPATHFQRRHSPA